MKQQWVSIESRLVVSAQDQAAVEQLDGAVAALSSLARRFPSLLHLIRDDRAGQPRSGLAAPSGHQDPWCWDHERPASQCIEDSGWPCSGELLAGPSDPTGTAAVSGDRAAGDHRALLAEVTKLTDLVDRLVRRAAMYPAQAVERESVEAGPGDEWCRSCWKDSKYCTPVTIKPGTSTPFYRGLCRWCGQTAKEIGGDPPTWLLEVRHRGDRINQGHIDKAKAELTARKKAKKARSK